MKNNILSVLLLFLSWHQINCQVYEAFSLTEQPQYNGGYGKLFEDIATSKIYPWNAYHNKKGGSIHVRFIIDSIGQVKEPAILKGIQEDLDNEAIRLVSTLTGWIPGENNGRKVNVWFVLTINFDPKRPGKVEPEPKK